MSGRTSPPPFFPPTSPTTQQTVIEAYPYAQYTDDDAVQAFFLAYNYLAQQWINDFNNLNLPLYCALSGSMLDWVAQGLYNLTRPILGTLRARPAGEGPYNTANYNILPYAAGILSGGPAPVYQPVTDDEFQRIITWHTYKGDSYQYSTRWLKQRVHRFLNGAHGILTTNDNTYDVSITYNGTNATIEVPASSIAETLSLAILDGVLALPFEYSYTVGTFTTASIFPSVNVRIGQPQIIASTSTWIGPVSTVFSGVLPWRNATGISAATAQAVATASVVQSAIAALQPQATLTTNAGTQ